jgi:hypothetical protein
MEPLTLAGEALTDGFAPSPIAIAMRISAVLLRTTPVLALAFPDAWRAAAHPCHATQRAPRATGTTSRDFKSVSLAFAGDPGAHAAPPPATPFVLSTMSKESPLSAD